MTTVILGAGSIGFRLAQQLIEEDQDVVLIEKDPQRAESASDLLDCLVINEVGNSAETLRQAGIAKADYFVAVTDSDEINMIACGIVASDFEQIKKIARVRNIDYWGTNVISSAVLGIDYVVSPEIEVAKSVVNAVERGAVSDVMFFEKTGLQMRSITIANDSPFIGYTIEAIRKSMQAQFLVAVVFRAGDYIIPSGTEVILEGDRLYLIATESDFKHIFSAIGKEPTGIDRIAIVGGGRIGRYVIKHLIDEEKPKSTFWSKLFRIAKPLIRRRITVVERDYEVCKEVSDEFPKVMVINADISDEKVQIEELFPSVDLLVATTTNQELNIVTAVYAKAMGTKRSIALVNRPSYVHIATGLDIDVVLSPTESMVGTILKYIRGASVQSLHTIAGGGPDVFEVTVVPPSRALGKAIHEIRLPANALIISVTRNGENIVPTGDLTIEPEDDVIIIARKESIPRLEEIFIG